MSAKINRTDALGASWLVEAAQYTKRVSVLRPITSWRNGTLIYYQVMFFCDANEQKKHQSTVFISTAMDIMHCKLHLYSVLLLDNF